ncbi:MAG TPA: sigma factor-like helix-turn-helix DNA-binding protein [Acidimicrobiia bacterium]|nr:sigma factor-like helix-turn-helix DNA-binding protein [Acidimicrobiia bacterium]
MEEFKVVVSGDSVGVSDFADFYEGWRDPIRRALALSTGDVAMADEAVDEAMTRAMGSWEQVGAYERPEGWVYRVGLNWARGRYRRRGYELLTSIDPERPAAFDPPDLDVIDAVGSLSARLREVVIARYYLDWSTSDVARALQIPEGTVKSRLARALTRLAKNLGEPS